MPESALLSNLASIGSVITPILIIGLSAIGWRVKSAISRKFELEDKLRDDRIEIYKSVVEPFIILLTTDKAWNSDPKNKKKDKTETASQILLSLEYRKKCFELSFFGSDEVVRSYNNLLQHGFNAELSSEGSMKEMIKLFGNLLLEIRKSMGNETSELTAQDMIEWWMTDARSFFGATS